MSVQAIRRTSTLALITAVALMVSTPSAIATEEPAFETIAEFETFEVRRYQPFVVAEVLVDSSFEDAGSRAFRTLFRYISGANQGTVEIEMTAPVRQSPADGERIEMTAPVLHGSAADGARHRVSFVLPTRFDLSSAPQPTDSAVRLRQVPSRLMAVSRYSGRWTEQRFREHEQRLLRDVAQRGYTPLARSEWARYDDPFTLWFLRRNEVLVEVAKSGLAVR